MKTKFPGQTALLYFNRDQLEVLSSVACNEVFNSMLPTEARSIRESAQDLGKSPASVGEHVASLLDVGLVIKAGSRKRRSRTEQLYIHKSYNNRIEMTGQEQDVLELFIKQFRGEMRACERQLEAYVRIRSVDESIRIFGMHEWSSVFLTPENSLKVKEAIQDVHDLMTRLAESDAEKREDGEHIRIKLSSVMFPTASESKRLLDESS